MTVRVLDTMIIGERKLSFSIEECYGSMVYCEPLRTVDNGQGHRDGALRKVRFQRFYGSVPGLRQGGVEPPTREGREVSPTHFANKSGIDEKGDGIMEKPKAFDEYTEAETALWGEAEWENHCAAWDAWNALQPPHRQPTSCPNCGDDLTWYHQSYFDTTKVRHCMRCERCFASWFVDNGEFTNHRPTPYTLVEVREQWKNIWEPTDRAPGCKHQWIRQEPYEKNFYRCAVCESQQKG